MNVRTKMISKISDGLNLIKNMGFRYVCFRAVHEMRVRTGIFKKQFPLNPAETEHISLKDWKKLDLFFLNGRLDFDQAVPEKLRAEFENFKQGKLTFFNATIFHLGRDYNWVTNPENGYCYPQVHWTEINDYDPKIGDIKYVWEKSRFSYIHTVIRYDAYSGEDNSQLIWNDIKSWMESNPINLGPNYKCSQEISLRIFNWTFALNFYKNADSLTDSFFQQVMHYIYWQLKHVYANINFSRIAVRNNHAITETLALYLGGILYPFFPESKDWKRKGRKWFEQEIEYQVYEDGTFLQFSMNYHRVVVQLFNLAFAVTEKNNEKFSSVVYGRAYKSLNFLARCMEKSSGWLPNYGSNDGALFFKVSDANYRDYRPQLNCLHIFLTGKPLFEIVNDQVSEESIWFKAGKIETENFSAIEQINGWHQFTIGGYYLLREDDGLTFIRCGNHKDRPAQADNLHLDIWYKGKNILYDGGTYKYNTSPELINYFMGTASHNTVMLDNHNQMKKGSRFIWFNWTQAVYAKTLENEDSYTFEGQIEAFKYVNESIRHTRKIRKIKGRTEWIIEDTIINKPEGMKIKQIFHPDDLRRFSSYSIDEKKREIKPEIQSGFRSDYYGEKEKKDFYSFNTLLNGIQTKLTIE